MDFSLTPSQTALTIGPCWTAFQLWELSASLPEKIMRMEELTSTCSLILDDASAHAQLRSSMLRVTTRMCRHHEENLTRATTTPPRTETSSPGDYNGRMESRAEKEILLMIRNGERLRVQRVETSFGDWFASWTQSLLWCISPLFPNSPIGNTLQSEWSTRALRTLSFLEEKLMDEMRGLNRLLQILQVSDAS